MWKNSDYSIAPNKPTLHSPFSKISRREEKMVRAIDRVRNKNFCNGIALAEINIQF